MASVLLGYQVKGWIMLKIKDSGHILVKFMISLILVSVVSTVVLNFHSGVNQQVYYKDSSSSQLILTNDVFDKISYHLKLAGFANSRKCQFLEIDKGEKSDSLVVRHNDIEIAFFVDSNNDENNGILYTSVDGSRQEILKGVKNIRFDRISTDRVVINLTLCNNDDEPGIVSRSFSTSVKLDYY